jgi:hypothetical protein
MTSIFALLSTWKWPLASWRCDKLRGQCRGTPRWWRLFVPFGPDITKLCRCYQTSWDRSTKWSVGPGHIRVQADDGTPGRLETYLVAARKGASWGGRSVTWASCSTPLFETCFEGRPTFNDWLMHVFVLCMPSSSSRQNDVENAWACISGTYCFVSKGNCSGDKESAGV